jgi:hypothetical protein
MNFADPLSESFFLGGFECSAHRRRDGARLDLLAATGHDRYPARDYETLASLEIRLVRDGLHWHRIEERPGGGWVFWSRRTRYGPL